MTQYRRLEIRWYNILGAEIGREEAFNERDASDKLRTMVSGIELSAGDTFRVLDMGE